MMRLVTYRGSGSWAGALCLVALLSLTPNAQRVAPDWPGTLPRDISQSQNGSALRPAIAAGADGWVFAVWSDGSTAIERDIHAAYSTDGGYRWSQPPRLITSTVPASILPDVVAAGDRVIVAWTDEQYSPTPSRRIYEAEAEPEGAEWTWTVRQLPMDPWQAHTRPQLAVGAGRLHMVFTAGGENEADVYHAMRWLTDTAWLTPTIAYTHVAGLGSWYPSLALSADGSVLHMVWEERDSSDVSAVLYMSGTVSNTTVTWHTPAVTLSTGITLSVWPAVAVGKDGFVHAVWGEKVSGASSACGSTVKEQYVRYRRFDPATGQWSPAVRVNEEPACVNVVNPTDLSPRIVVVEPVGAEPQVCVVWHGFWPGGQAEEVWLSCSCYRCAQMQWSRPQNVSRSGGTEQMSIIPAVAVDTGGELHIVWQERTGQSAILNYQAYYSRSLPFRHFLPVVMREAFFSAVIGQVRDAGSVLFRRLWRPF